MANRKHLKILKQGVDVWNGWREKNPEIEPDLSYASLFADMTTVRLCLHPLKKKLLSLLKQR